MFIQDPTVDVNGFKGDFNNNKTQASLSRTSNYFPRYLPVLVNASSSTALTVDNLMKGRLGRTFTGVDVADTLPTAADIVTEMKARHPLGTSMPNNTGFEFYVYYSSSGGGNYSFISNTGVTIFGENDLDNERASVVLVVATNVSSGSETVIVTWLPGDD